MAETVFEWDYDAAGDLMLRSDAIAAVCKAEAEKMTRATGVEYIPYVRMGSQRVIVKALKKAEGKEKGKRWKLCPKCGKYHPNCTCAENKEG